MAYLLVYSLIHEIEIIKLYILCLSWRQYNSRLRPGQYYSKITKLTDPIRYVIMQSSFHYYISSIILPAGSPNFDFLYFCPLPTYMHKFTLIFFRLFFENKWLFWENIFTN